MVPDQSPLPVCFLQQVAFAIGLPSEAGHLTLSAPAASNIPGVQRGGVQHGHARRASCLRTRRLRMPREIQAAGVEGLG